MAHPWNYPPVRADYQAAAGVLTQLSQGRSADDLLNAISPGEVILLEHGTLNPPALVNITPDYLLIAISGTENWLQWICHFLGSSQVTNSNYPGKVNGYFAANADSLLEAITDFIPLLETRRLVVLGHSFGGAIAQLVATKLQGEATRGVVTIVFGCPRVGDPKFADSATYPCFRVQTFGDCVPSFPPINWAGLGTPWTGFINLVPATYSHGGTVVTLDENGKLGDTDNTMGFTDGVSVAAAQRFAPHAIETYTQYLERVFEAPLDTVWKEPSTVQELLSWEAIYFSPGVPGIGGGMSLIQGIMYFRTSERVWGWGESWTGQTDITDMLTNKLPGLAPTRAITLANTCEIFAYKASDISPLRTRNLSKSVLLDVPIPGKGQGTNIKDLGNGASNILVDAIDYEVLSGAGSRRIYPFRGIPDSWVGQSKRTGDGIAADKAFKKFFAAAQTAGLGFKLYDRAQPQNPINTIAKDPVTGLLQITYPGHALATRNIVTIRALKANPMVNGRWRVLVNDPNMFSLVGSARFDVLAAGQGTWQKYNIVPDPIGAYDFNDVSTRKMGKVFGQRRGKAAARLLHH